MTSFVVAYLVIKLFLKFLEKFTFVAFGIYRIVFGILILSTNRMKIISACCKPSIETLKIQNSHKTLAPGVKKTWKKVVNRIIPIIGFKPLIKKDRRICDKRTIANTKAMIRTFVIKLFAQKISKRKANMANNLLRGSKR